MKKVIIQELNSKEVQTHSNGKKYCNVGLKVNGKWHNGSMWEHDIARFQKLKPGDEILIDIYENTGKDGKVYENFRLPSIYQEINFKLDLIINLLTPIDEPAGASVKNEEPPEDEPDMPF